MSSGPYDLATARPARRALSDLLPPDVAMAAVELITGPLLDAPRRVGQPLRHELSGLFVARLGRDWRVIYEIDEARHVVNVVDIQRHAPAYRRR